MLDYNKPAIPMPESCNSLIERFYPAFATATNTAESGPSTDSTTTSADGILPINQLTINEYLPGQGINSHTDTETCLGPEIFILNLESDIVMTLTKK